MDLRVQEALSRNITALPSGHVGDRETNRAPAILEQGSSAVAKTGVVSIKSMKDIVGVGLILVFAVALTALACVFV
jgi:hypothetical protein